VGRPRSLWLFFLHTEYTYLSYSCRLNMLCSRTWHSPQNKWIGRRTSGDRRETVSCTASRARWTKTSRKEKLPRLEGGHMIMSLEREREEEALLGLLWEFHAGWRRKKRAREVLEIRKHRLPQRQYRICPLTSSNMCVQPLRRWSVVHIWYYRISKCISQLIHLGVDGSCLMGNVTFTLTRWNAAFCILVSFFQRLQSHFHRYRWELDFKL